MKVAAPGIPTLVIERWDSNLSFTHDTDSEGQQRVESRLIFTVSNQGLLNLTETETYPNGEEQKGLDRGYARAVSGNLIKPECIAAAILAQTTPPDISSQTVTAESPANVAGTPGDLNSAPVVSSSPQEEAIVGDSEVSDSLLPSPKVHTGIELGAADAYLRAQKPVLESGTTALDLQDPKESVNEQGEQKKHQEQETPASEISWSEPQQTLLSSVAPLEQWITAAQALGRQQNYLLRIQQVNESAQQGKALSDKAQDSMGRDLEEYQKTLSQLRNWYRIARDRLAKPTGYLQRIQTIGSDFKEGVPLSAKAVVAMNRDLGIPTQERVETRE